MGHGGPLLYLIFNFNYRALMAQNLSLLDAGKKSLSSHAAPDPHFNFCTGSEETLLQTDWLQTRFFQNPMPAETFP